MDSCVDCVAAESSLDDQASTDVLGLLARKAGLIRTIIFGTDYYLRIRLSSHETGYFCMISQYTYQVKTRKLHL